MSLNWMSFKWVLFVEYACQMWSLYLFMVQKILLWYKYLCHRQTHGQAKEYHSGDMQMLNLSNVKGKKVFFKCFELETATHLTTQNFKSYK